MITNWFYARASTASKSNHHPKLLVSLIVMIAASAGILIPKAFSISQNKIYKIRFVHGLPDRHRMAVQMKEFAEMLNHDSDGRLQVKVYPAGQLYHDKYIIAAVRSGACEMGALYPFNLATIEPNFKIFGIPMALTNRDELKYILEGDILKKLFSSLEAKGIHPVGVIVGFISEETGVISKSPVHLPSDLNGKKIRTSCSEQVLYFKKYCNASSANVSGAELYIALQRGTIDALTGSLTHQVSRRLYEVAPYMIMLPVAANPSFFIMNQKFYTNLPEDLKKVISIVSEEIRRKSYESSVNLYDEYLFKAKDVSEEIYIPSDKQLKAWNVNIVDYWKTVTKDQPDLFDIIMELKKYRDEKL